MRKFRLKGMLYLLLCGGLCAALLLPVFAESTDDTVTFIQMDAVTPTPEIPFSEEMPVEEPSVAQPPTQIAAVEDEAAAPELPDGGTGAPNETPAVAPELPDSGTGAPNEIPAVAPELPDGGTGAPNETPAVAPELPDGGADASMLSAAQDAANDASRHMPEPTHANATPPDDALRSAGRLETAPVAAGQAAATTVVAQLTPTPLPEYDGSFNQPQLNAEEMDLDDGLHQSVPPRFPEGIVARGGDETIAMSYDEIAALVDSLPEGLSDARKSVVIKAYSLVGNVSYYWGGKSTALGWDVRWGNPAYVASNGSEGEAVLRTFGLDCSGYVSWVFCNAADTNQPVAIGNGSSNQWARSGEIDQDDALPGDLAFFAAPGERPINHVGIVVGNSDDGRMLVAHCSSSRNSVVITEAEETGFKRFRRPDIFEDEAFAQSAETVFLQCGYPAHADESFVPEDGAVAGEYAQPDENGFAFGDSVTLNLEREAVDGEAPCGIVIGKEGESWIVAFPVAEGTRVVYARSEDMQRAD